MGEDKKVKFEKHLENSKQYLKDRLFNILNETSFEKFSSKSLQKITNELRDIETLQDFLNNELGE